LPPAPEENAGRRPHRVHLEGVEETLLLPLYAKALDSRSKHPILGDVKADEMVRAIDYDFEKLHRFGNGNVMVVRARQIDEWVREFLSSNPNAAVLNVGCGLDARVSRIGPPPGVSWFDLDFPEVIAERRNFFSDAQGYRMVESSITDPKWLERVPGDRPVLVVADGVMEYLTEDEVKAFLNRVTGRFARGQVVFDVMNSYAVERGRSSLKQTMGTAHRWAVDDVRAVDGMDPLLRRVSSMTVFRSRYFPLRFRVVFGAASLVPSFGNTMRLLRYEFGPAASDRVG